jgi:hypothetical protein
MPRVYEAINETLKELFVGLTDLPIDQLEARHKNGLPPVIAHWKLGTERISYRDVGTTIPDPSIAKSLVESFSRNMQRTGWKSITE